MNDWFKFANVSSRQSSPDENDLRQIKKHDIAFAFCTVPFRHNLKVISLDIALLLYASMFPSQLGLFLLSPSHGVP